MKYQLISQQNHLRIRSMMRIIHCYSSEIANKQMSEVIRALYTSRLAADH